MSQMQTSNTSDALNLLVDASVDFADKLKRIQDMTESLDDIIHGNNYVTFLHNNIPILFQFLRES